MVAHVKVLRLRSLDVTSLSSKPRLQLVYVRRVMKAHHSVLKRLTRQPRLARSKVRGSRANLDRRVQQRDFKHHSLVCRALVKPALQPCRVLRRGRAQQLRPRNSVFLVSTKRHRPLVRLANSVLLVRSRVWRPLVKRVQWAHKQLRWVWVLHSRPAKLRCKAHRWVCRAHSRQLRLVLPERRWVCLAQVKQLRCVQAALVRQLASERKSEPWAHSTVRWVSLAQVRWAHWQGSMARLVRVSALLPVNLAAWVCSKLSWAKHSRV